jgi:hypothetical protein
MARKPQRAETELKCISNFLTFDPYSSVLYSSTPDFDGGDDRVPGRLPTGKLNLELSATPTTWLNVGRSDRPLGAISQAMPL